MTVYRSILHAIQSLAPWLPTTYQFKAPLCFMSAHFQMQDSQIQSTVHVYFPRTPSPSKLWRIDPRRTSCSAKVSQSLERLNEGNTWGCWVQGGDVDSGCQYDNTSGHIVASIMHNSNDCFLGSANSSELVCTWIELYRTGSVLNHGFRFGFDNF